MDYKETQRRLDDKAKKDYSEAYSSLTPQQRVILFNTKCDEPNQFGSSTNGKENNGISIVQNSHKQEPNAKKLCYDESGNPDIAESFNYDHLDSREDIVKECIQRKGNLKRLIESFVFHDLRSYQTQLFTKFANLIIDADNPKLELQSILKAAGVEIEDAGSGQRLAKEYNVTRQALSKKTIGKKNKLGLPDNTRDSKNSETREVYRQNNHINTKL